MKRVNGDFNGMRSKAACELTGEGKRCGHVIVCVCVCGKNSIADGRRF